MFRALVLLWITAAAVVPASAQPVFGDGFEPTSLASLSDAFDTPQTLARWQRVSQREGWGRDPVASVDIDQTRPGWLTLVPQTSSWYEDYVGEMFYREASGDFVVEARVQSRNRTGSGAPGSSQGGADGTEYSLAGLMLRAPRPEVEAGGPAAWTLGGERYVFLSFGSANLTGSYQTEVKTTRAAQAGETHSISVLEIGTAPGDTLDLRLARIGPHVIALLRTPGTPWQVHRRYLRNDFPPTLQAGITCYTDWEIAGTYPYFEQNTTLITHAWNDPGRLADPDLRVQVDWVRFFAPAVPPELAGAALSDPALVSDAALLAFLGQE
jgi:hypothetical protein